MVFVKNDMDLKNNNFRLIIILKVLEVVKEEYFDETIHSTFMICFMIYALTKDYLDTEIEFEILSAFKKFFPRLRMISREEIPSLVVSLKTLVNYILI